MSSSDLFDAQVMYPGHDVLTETLIIPYGPDQYSALKHDFKLRRTASATVRAQAEPSPSCNYALHPEGGGTKTCSTWNGLTVGFSLVTLMLIDWRCPDREDDPPGSLWSLYLSNTLNQTVKQKHEKDQRSMKACRDWGLHVQVAASFCGFKTVQSEV